MEGGEIKGDRNRRAMVTNGLVSGKHGDTLLQSPQAKTHQSMQSSK